MLCRIKLCNEGLFQVHVVNLANKLVRLGLDNFVEPFYDGKEIWISVIHFRRIAMSSQIEEIKIVVIGSQRRKKFV